MRRDDIKQEKAESGVEQLRGERAGTRSSVLRGPEEGVTGGEACDGTDQAGQDADRERFEGEAEAATFRVALVGRREIFDVVLVRGVTLLCSCAIVLALEPVGQTIRVDFREATLVPQRGGGLRVQLGRCLRPGGMSASAL